LIADLKSLPRHAAVRKVNEFVKRTRRAKVHALICETLRSKFGIFGKERKQQELINTMDNIFKQVSAKYNVPMGDFPNSQKFGSIVKNFEMWKFPQLKPEQIAALDEVLARGVPKLLEDVETKRHLNSTEDDMKNTQWNPFEFNVQNDISGMSGIQWIITQQKKNFMTLNFILCN